MATKTTASADNASDKGRYKEISLREARAAARAKVTIDKRRGVRTPKWIVDLAKKSA